MKRIVLAWVKKKGFENHDIVFSRFIVDVRENT